MAAALTVVKGAMTGFDESSSDDDDDRPSRQRPSRASAASHSLATSASSVPPSGAAAPAKEPSPTDGVSILSAVSKEDYEARLEEAAFARATALHIANVRAGRDIDASPVSGAEAAAHVVHSSRAGDDASSATLSADPSALRPMLLLPCLKDAGTIRCFVIRQRFVFGNPIFRLFDEASGKFLMAGQKRAGSRTSNYLLSMESTPSRDSGLVVGKVRANWAGSIYTVYDGGMAPEDAVTDASLRQELAVIGFDWDRIGPGKMRAAIPRVKKGSTPVVFRARKAVDSLAAAAAKKDSSKVLVLKSKQPQWNEEIQGHVLDFKGRVTMSSVKNFQLASDETGDETLLQFGRIDKDKFTMDFQHPLSFVQAFGIVMAAVDGKLADRKAFKSLAGKGILEDDGLWFAHWDHKEA